MSLHLYQRIPENLDRYSHGDLLKRKAQPKGVALKPLSYKRVAVRLAQKKLARVMRSFFAAILPKVTEQLVAAVNKVVKAEQDDEIEQILGAISFEDLFSDLPASVQPALTGIFEDAAQHTIGNITAAVRTTTDEARVDPTAFDQVSEDAVAYSEARSAEMVGMKYNADGELVPNPNAIWRIDETTRDGIRSLVTDTVDGRLSVIDLPKALAESYGFSNDRAELIARTEVHKANGEGALAGMRASGVVEEKVWLTSNDDLVEEECEANQDQGPVALDDDFQSGDAAEPAHPRCRCAVAPWVTFETEQEQPT